MKDDQALKFSPGDLIVEEDRYLDIIVGVNSFTISTLTARPGRYHVDRVHIDWLTAWNSVLKHRIHFTSISEATGEGALK